MLEPVRREVAFADGAMSYLEWESPGAPLLVFSHANGFNASTYKTLLSPLAGPFRVIAIDMRGHGLTTLPLNKAVLSGWRVYRDDLLRFLDRLNAEPAVLAGHSLGASVSLLAAAKQSGLARALVLIEPVFVIDAVAIGAMTARWFRQSEKFLPLAAGAKRRRTDFSSREDALNGFTGRGAFKTWPREVIGDYLETGLVPEGNAFRLATPPDWEAATFSTFPVGLLRTASRVRGPVTIVVGTRKSSASCGLLAALRERKPDTRIVRVDGASHFLPMEKPDVVRSELRRAAGL